MLSHNLLSALATITIIAGIFGLCLVGTIGLTRSVHHYLARRKQGSAIITALTIITALAAFLFLWLPYIIWLPFNKIFRSSSRLRWLRIVGPIASVVAVFIGIGTFMDSRTVYPTFVNDTPWQVEVSDCTPDPMTLSPGQTAAEIAIAKGTTTCSVVIDTDSQSLPVCLQLPAHIDSHTTIRVSPYTRRSC
jgi:hypothetical protein